MKYIIFTFMTIVSLSTFGQNLKFNGELIGLEASTKVILSDMMGKKFHDTAAVSSNKFDINCSLPGAGLYVLRVGLVGKNPENRILYLDSGNVKLNGTRGSLKKAALSGDENYMKDWLNFDRILENDPVLLLQKRQNDTVIMLTAKTGSYDGLWADTAFVKRSGDLYPIVEAKKRSFAKNWLVENPTSDINAYIIYKYLRRELTPEELKKSLARLSPAARNSFLGRKLIEVNKSNQF